MKAYTQQCSNCLVTLLFSYFISETLNGWFNRTVCVPSGWIDISARVDNGCVILEEKRNLGAPLILTSALMSVAPHMMKIMTVEVGPVKDNDRAPQSRLGNTFARSIVKRSSENICGKTRAVGDEYAGAKRSYTETGMVQRVTHNIGNGKKLCTDKGNAIVRYNGETPTRNINFTAVKQVTEIVDIAVKCLNADGNAVPMVHMANYGFGLPHTVFLNGLLCPIRHAL